MIGKVVFGVLSNDSAVSAFVSNRIYPVVIPENQDFPAISFFTSSSDPDKQKTEPSSQDNANVQIKCVHDNYMTSLQIGEAVRSALDKLKGVHYGVEVQATFFSGGDDIYDQSAKKHMRVLNFNFIYKY